MNNKLFQELLNWEQGRGKPDGLAKILLNVAARYPEAVFNTVYS
jgi:DNA-binding transcriptional regulator YiaG